MGQKRIILAVMKYFISAQHAHKLSYDHVSNKLLVSYFSMMINDSKVR